MFKRSRYDFNKRHLLGAFRGWGWQDFTTPVGAGPLTLTDNENGTYGVFNGDNVVAGSSVIVTSADPAKKAYTGTTKLFSSVVKCTNATATTIVLSGVPHTNWGTLRVYFLYDYAYGMPIDYEIPSRHITESLWTEIGDLFQTEEEVPDGSNQNEVLYWNVATGAYIPATTLAGLTLTAPTFTNNITWTGDGVILDATDDPKAILMKPEEASALAIAISGLTMMDFNTVTGSEAINFSDGTAIDFNFMGAGDINFTGGGDATFNGNVNVASGGGIYAPYGTIGTVDCPAASSMHLLASSTSEFEVAPYYGVITEAPDSGTCYQIILMGMPSGGGAYEFQVDGASTFKWRKDAGAWTTGVARTTIPTLLENNIRYSFRDRGSDTWSTNDLWSVTITSSPNKTLNVDTVTETVTMRANTILGTIGSGDTHAIIMKDNHAQPFSVAGGQTGSYINIATTTGSESIALGNASDNPDFNFVGSGTTSITGDLTVGTTDFIVDTTAGGITIGSADGSDSMSISHDNTNAVLTTNDGGFKFSSDEGVNSRTKVWAIGNGTGNAIFQATSGGDESEVFFAANSNGTAEISFTGDAQTLFYIDYAANTSGITMFQGSASDETNELKIYGYRTSDAKRSLEIGVGVDAADTASFDGVSNYLFDGATIHDSISVGTSSPSGGFSGAGDIYATSGIKAMEGLYSEAVAYGAGLEVADNSQPTTYTNVLTGTATLTAATQIIYDPEGDFVNDGVDGQFLKVITATAGGSPGQYVGATGQIDAVVDATHLVISFGSAGGDTIIDATAMSFVIYPEPVCYISDNGDVHYCVGVHDDASFKVCTDVSNNDHAVHFVTTAGIDGNTGLDIEYDAHTFGGTSAMHINYDATAFASVGTLGTGLDVVIDNTGATAGDVHVIDVALGDPANSDLEVEAIVTHEGVDPIAQYLGEPATLDYGATYDDSTTTYTNETADFNNNAVHTPIFTEDDDYVYVASAAKFDEINVLLQTAGSHTIIPTFEFSLAGGTWTAFTPADDTVGFSQNGTIRFESNLLTNWGVRTVNEVTGLTGAVDYYWIRIKRTRNVLPTSPIEDTIQVTALGAKLGWDKTGRLAIKTYSQAGEPDVTDLPANKFCFWIDTDDSKLYLCYNQSGTIKTTEMT